MYQYYKSSQQHNVKKTVPLKPFIIFGLCAVIIVSSGVYAVSSIKTTEEQPPTQAAPPKPKKESNPVSTFLHTNDSDSDNEFPDGFTASTMMKTDLGISYQVAFRYKGDLHFVDDYRYQFKDGRVSVMITDNEVFTFRVPKDVVL